MEENRYIQASPSSLEERAQRQQEVYWRIRAHKTLERLEKEARRMLHLEADLSGFAEYYYCEVGAYAERLNQLESQIIEITPQTLENVQAQREVEQARRGEIKSRYRALAKEIHPDRSMAVDNTGLYAQRMQTLNEAYAQGDLSTMLRLEAEVLLDASTPIPLEQRLREIERAADTYAAGYRQLLNSPLNELMLRHMVAQQAGWNWVEAVVLRMQETIEAHEQALAYNTAAIGALQPIQAA